MKKLALLLFSVIYSCSLPVRGQDVGTFKVDSLAFVQCFSNTFANDYSLSLLREMRDYLVNGEEMFNDSLHARIIDGKNPWGGGVMWASFSWSGFGG